MSTETNKAAVRRFRDALNAGDLDEAVAVFSPNAVVHVSGAPDPLTVEGFRQFGRAMLSAGFRRPMPRFNVGTPCPPPSRFDAWPSSAGNPPSKMGSRSASTINPKCAPVT